MKAPKKIYLEKEYPDNRILPNGISYSQTSTNIEYTRTDAFIEKAIEWLKCQDEMVGISFQEDFIERFKDYMKGE